MSERKRKRGGGGGGGKSRAGGPATVAARFQDVAAARAFFVRLGMPVSLVKQLAEWLEGLAPADELERMEPELTWEGRATRLTIDAVVDEDGEVDVEFGGPASLIDALQADLDEAFGGDKA